MTVGELIEELSKFPKEFDVLVWDGYNAGSMTSDFNVTEDGNDSQIYLERQS